MDTIIPAIDRELIKSELSKDFFIRYTNFENNEIYIFTARDCPHTMKEIGRLREIAYRDGGGGSGKQADIDQFDTMENPYRQMVVWNPNEEEIIGGYRFYELKDARTTKEGAHHIATGNMFKLSQRFVEEYLPYTIELGKSFIQPQYQPTTDPRRGLFSLDNLWDGLGALIVDYPHIKYFYGRVTLYLKYHKKARDILLYYLYKYFGDKDNLVVPFKPEKIRTAPEILETYFSGDGFEDDFTNLNQAIRDLDESIPPLVKAYMSLSPTMKVFGIAHNDAFGDNVEGIGIMIKIDDIFPEKTERHVESYLKEKKERQA